MSEEEVKLMSFYTRYKELVENYNKGGMSFEKMKEKIDSLNIDATGDAVPFKADYLAPVNVEEDDTSDSYEEESSSEYSDDSDGD